MKMNVKVQERRINSCFVSIQRLADLDFPFAAFAALLGQTLQSDSYSPLGSTLVGRQLGRHA